MESIYVWIRNIAVFFIFVSLIYNLLPDKNYEKYIRLFAGMIMILLVLHPFTGRMRLEDRIANFYEGLVFQYEADELKENILGTEKLRLETIIRQYEQAVVLDVTSMVEDLDVEVVQCQAQIEEDEEKESFGNVTKVSIDGQIDGQQEPSYVEEKVKQKIMSYYQLEEYNVEIQIVAKEG